MDTNTQNPQPVQPAVEGPVQGPVQPAATPEVTPPKKKGGFAKILVALFAVVAIGGGAGWYFMGMPGLDTAETPPTLELGGGQFQGRSIDSGFGSLKFDANDVATYQAPAGAGFAKATKGVQYFYADEDLAVEEIIKQVKPIDGMNFLITSYGTDGPNSQPCFHMYPKGPYVNTCEITDPKGRIFKAGSVFAMLVSKDFEYNSNIIKNAKSTPTQNFYKDYIDTVEGWVLIPFKDNKGLSHQNVKYSFILDGDNSFKEGKELKNGYKLAWVFLEKGANPPLPVPAEVDRVVKAGDCEIEIVKPYTAGRVAIEEDMPDGTVFEIAVLKGEDVIDTFKYMTGDSDHNVKFNGKKEVSTLDKAVKIKGAPRSGEEAFIKVVGFHDDNGRLGAICEATLTIVGNQPTPLTLLDPPTLELGGAKPTPPSLKLDLNYDCGNNKVDDDSMEVCDGNDLLGLTCETFDSKYQGGTLSCSNKCLYWDATQCTEEVDGAVEIPTPDLGGTTPEESNGLTVVSPITVPKETDLRIKEPTKEPRTSPLTNVPINDNLVTVAAISAVEKVTDLSNPMILESGKVAGIERDLFAINTKQEGIEAVLVYPELMNGQDVAGDGMAPSKETAVLAFEIASSSLDIIKEVKFDFNGCFAGGDTNNPATAPELYLENDFLSGNAPIATDVNLDGVFSPKEFTGSERGLEMGVSYVVAMNTSNSCTFGVDSGSVEFDMPSANHESLTELVFS